MATTIGYLETVCVSCFSRVQLSAALWTAAHQAPLSLGFSRQEYWSGLPFPPPGDLPKRGISPASPTLADRFFTSSDTWEAHLETTYHLYRNFHL